MPDQTMVRKAEAEMPFLLQNRWRELGKAFRMANAAVAEAEPGDDVEILWESSLDSKHNTENDDIVIDVDDPC